MREDVYTQSKDTQCSFPKADEDGTTTADTTRRINKQKITDNEVNSLKYLFMKFMYLYKQ